MKKNISFMAKQALGRVQRGEFDNLSSAVKGLKKEAGLNDEQTHRLIEAVNREAHAQNFNVDSPSYVSFDIAKPDEVFEGEKLASEVYVNRVRPNTKSSEYIPGSEFIDPLDMFGVEPSTKLAGRRRSEERPFRVKEVADDLLKLAREEVIVSRVELCDSLEVFLKEASEALHDNTLDDLASFVAQAGPTELMKQAFACAPKLAEDRDIKVSRGKVRYLAKPEKKHPLSKACKRVKEAEARASAALSDLREAAIAHRVLHKYASGELSKHTALKEILEKCAGILSGAVTTPLMFGFQGLSTIPFVLGEKKKYQAGQGAYQPKPSYGHTLRKTGEEKTAGLRLSIGGSRKSPTVGRLAQNAAKWGLALGLASVIGGAGGSALSSALESGDKALNLGGAINRAVEHDPELKKIPKKQLVTGASTLWDLNKDFAKQPMLMASWLKRVEQMPDAALALAPQMLGAREKAIKAKTDPGTMTGALRGLSRGSSDVLDL